MKVESDVAVADEVSESTDAPAPKRKSTKKPKVAKANGKANGKHAAPAKKAKSKKTEAKAKAPRQRDPAKLDEYGFRKGSIKSRAAAMYKKGATLAEVKEAVGSVQFNVLNELKANGYKIKETEVEGKNGRNATEYQIGGKGK